MGPGYGGCIQRSTGVAVTFVRLIASTRFIHNIGGDSPPSPDEIVEDVTDVTLQAIYSALTPPNNGVVLNPDHTLTIHPPVNPPPGPPDIQAMIHALASSPSIDQPTKNALIAALKGG